MHFAKTELHLHLDGSLPAETVLQLAQEQGIPLPAETAAALMPHLTVPRDCRSLADYLRCFPLPLRVLQTGAALSKATAALLSALIAEGMETIELRFAPQLHGERGLQQAEAVEAVLCAMQEASMRRVGLILCMMTNGDMAKNAETAALAVQYRGQGVVGLDLAGQEGARPLAAFAPLFARAAQENVGITVHAGEACGAESVAAALELGARRIGHGTRVIEDAAVLRRVIDAGVTLEQCITSNVQTCCAQAFETHPIRRLFDAGARIALCTDNRTVSGTTLQKEYELLQAKCGFSDADCAKIAQYAREASFL